MTFPLVCLPKRFVYVEDDQDFLDVLRMTLPQSNSRVFFDDPRAAQMALTQEAIHWSWLTDVLSRSHLSRTEGKGEAALYAGSYFNDWRRFSLTGVLVVDNGMPVMNGVQLIESLKSCPARRILLTGEADADFGIRAFNAGLIQRFIPKSSPHLYQEIIRCSEDMHQSVCEHFGYLIRPTLSSEQLGLLHDSKVEEGLRRKVEELGWAEYVTVGDPFGLLGMAHGGPLQWLQIETPHSMQQLAEAGESYEYPSMVVQQIRSGQAMANWELCLKLDIKEGGSQVVRAEEICASPAVLVGLFDVPVQVVTGKDHGIDDILGPSEWMGSLMRDVQLAQKQVGRSGMVGPGLLDAEVTLERVIRHMADASALSEGHKSAFEDSLSKISRDDPVHSEVHRLNATRG